MRDRHARLAALVLASSAWVVGLSGCSLFSRSGTTPGLAAPLPAPRVIPGELDPRILLGELPARASRLGAGAPSLVTSAEAMENEWVGGFVDVPQNACLLGYARGSSSIDDVDIAVYSDEGTQLAVDEGRDVHPTVLLCGPHPDRVYVAAHVAEGGGFVVVGAQLVPKERALIVGRALGARGALGEGLAPVDTWPGLEDAVRVHRLTLGGAWEEFKRVALSVDARMPTYVSLPIEADQCVDAVVVPDDEVALLDVEAIDSDSRVVARSREGVGARTLTLCSSLTLTGTLSVRPHLGRGRAAIVLARARAEAARDLASRPEVAWAASTEPLETAKRARDTLLAKSGYDPPAASTSGVLALGRRVTVPLGLRAATGGGCTRVDVIAGAPLALVDASIWDSAGTLLASGNAASSLTLFACAAGPARIELETRGRPGPFAIALRPERWSDIAFAGHPLAASRMLARAAMGPEMLFLGRDATARELALYSDRVVSWQESVGAGRCTHVTIGAQGDGSGVELRAFDAVEGTEIDRSEGGHAASVRTCAPPEGPRSVRFEARASAGRVDTVVGERTSKD